MTQHTTEPIKQHTYKFYNNEKIVIPEKIAIRLLNSSEVTADQFYKHILEQYRILNQMQQQRQQFLQKQHLQLQQLAAGNKFQEIFATATIIQANNANNPQKKPITPTNGTFLLDPRVQNVDVTSPVLNPETVPILDTAPAHLGRRKLHRKHHNNNHHRHTPRKVHANVLTPSNEGIISNDGFVHKAPLNPLPPVVVQESAASYTSMPIPLILNSKEDRRPTHRARSNKKSAASTRKHTSESNHVRYDTPAYINPFLTGELIFEK